MCWKYFFKKYKKEIGVSMLFRELEALEVLARPGSVREDTISS